MDDVKRSRADRAAATRQRILTAAYEMFCEQGYRATTMAGIAARAGVAVQTVYFTFHTKDALLQVLHDQSVQGPDGLLPPLQPWFRKAVAEPDPYKAVAVVVDGVAAILDRVAPMLPVWHAVAADAAGEVYRHGEELRRRAMRDIAADVLLPKCHPRPACAPERAADLMCVLLGPEPYHAFVIRQGWSQAEWVGWTTATLQRDLFEPPS